MFKEISIYHEHKYFSPLKDDFENTKELDWSNPKGMEGYVVQILYTIYKYKCINRTCIATCLNFRKKNKWKEKSLKQTLKSLRKEGYIRAYGTKTEPMGDKYEVVLYVLTAKGIFFLEEQGKSVNIDNIYDAGNICAEELLKQASMAQYHINLIKNYGFMLNSSKFGTYITKTKDIVPSMISFSRYGSSLELKSKRDKLILFGFPAPKKEEEIEDFFKTLLRVINAEVEDVAILKIVMIICENSFHAGWIAWNINMYRQMRPFPVLYMHDMITAFEDPLSNVLCCETDEEGIRKSNINFFKKDSEFRSK